MIELHRGSYDTIVDHTHDGNPYEVCGILGGQLGDETSRVESVHPAENAADTPASAYAIEPADLLELLETIDDEGRDVVGFYHSHPKGPSRPSATDVDRAAWDGRSYLIVELDGRHPYIGSWRWRDADDQFTQEVVRLL